MKKEPSPADLDAIKRAISSAYGLSDLSAIQKCVAQLCAFLREYRLFDLVGEIEAALNELDKSQKEILDAEQAHYNSIIRKKAEPLEAVFDAACCELCAQKDALAAQQAALKNATSPGFSRM